MDSGDGRLWPQQQVGGDFNALLVEATHRFGPIASTAASKRCKWRATCCVSAATPLSAPPTRRARARSRERRRPRCGRDAHPWRRANLARPRGWDLGVGGDVTFYGVPDVLRPSHGSAGVLSPLLPHAAARADGQRMMDMTMTGRGGGEMSGRRCLRRHDGGEAAFEAQPGFAERLLLGGQRAARSFRHGTASRYRDLPSRQSRPSRWRRRGA